MLNLFCTCLIDWSKLREGHHIFHKLHHFKETGYNRSGTNMSLLTMTFLLSTYFIVFYFLLKRGSKYLLAPEGKN